jgi:hypothetical protein
MTIDRRQAGTPTSEWHEDPNWQCAQRWLGWFSCCVEAHAISPIDAQVEAPRHPVTGHMLCLTCALGPLAPLPRRPADMEEFSDIREDEDRLAERVASRVAELRAERGGIGGQTK